MVVTNHAGQPRQAACRLVYPRSLGGRRSGWQPLPVAAKQEARIVLDCPLPADSPAGRHVIAVDVQFGERVLPRFTEALVDVG